MKNHILLTFIIFVLMVGCKSGGGGGGGGSNPTPTPFPEPSPISKTDFRAQTFAGYQGWFTTRNTSSLRQWSHWGPGSSPRPGRVTFEIYPDLREFPDSVLDTTDLGPLGNGEPSKLYGADNAEVVDTHFRWVSQYGLDGLALQRFLSEVVGDPRFRALRNKVTRLVKDHAQNHGKYFYVAYDISGMHEGDVVTEVQKDWVETMEGELEVPQSSAYARADGKPVVLIWGLGFPDRPGTPAQAVELAEWFKARGVFVVVGVPYGFRTGDGTKPGFLDAYTHFNMVQPWSVGAIATDGDILAHTRDVWLQDLNWCKQHNIYYQRILFPGFAWSNWNGGSQNMIPRRGGRFLWNQAVATRKLGISAMVAMFDEFDEGTAIAKAAENASMRPTSQYFYSLDADGIDMSSDFYLRLTGEVTKLMRGERPPSDNVPVPYRP